MKSSDSRTNSKYKSPYGCRTNSHCEKKTSGEAYDREGSGNAKNSLPHPNTEKVTQHNISAFWPAEQAGFFGVFQADEGKRKASAERESRTTEAWFAPGKRKKKKKKKNVACSAG